MQQTPLPPLNNPTPEQTFLEKNYDENTQRADRDPRDIPHPYRRVFSARRRPRWDLGHFLILSPDG